MFYYAHQAAAGSKITVTGTATNIYSLINTAASTSLPRAGFPTETNAIDITVEDGDIRVLFEGNTPTATNGMLLSSGNVYFFRGIPLDQMKLIRVSGNVSCSVMLGRSDRGESTNASAFDVKLESGDIEIGAVELKDGTTDTRAIINAANTARNATDQVMLVQNIDATGKVGGGGFAEDTAHVSGDVGTEILAKRTDTAACSATTDGNYATVNEDSLGHVWTREGYASAAEDNPNGVIAQAGKPLAVNTYSFSLFTNFGANATLNVKALPGNVFSVKCHNLNASDRYLQLHNTATVPAGSGVPLMTFLIPAGSERIIGTDFFGINGLNFSTGIAFAFSTTEGTYTAGTAGDQFTQIQYK